MERKTALNGVIHLFMTAARYNKKYESIPRSYGTEDILYSEESHTIDMIGKNEMISITEIAKRMGKTKSAISQLVDRLVKKGMLYKQSHPDNDRGLILKLTPKGEQVFQYHAEYDRIQYGKLFESLSDFSVRELSIYNEIQKEIIKWLKDDVAYSNNKKRPEKSTK